MPDDVSSTIDLTPDNSNRVAFVIGRIFHPYIIPFPTAFILLNGLRFRKPFSGPGWCWRFCCSCP